MIESLSRATTRRPRRWSSSWPTEGYILLGDEEAVTLADGVRTFLLTYAACFEQKNPATLR